MEITEGIALKPYVERASKGSEDVTQIVNEALSDPSVYVFQELLDVENVQKSKAVVDLLNVFAYGSYQDAKSLQLKPEQIKKLRQLTVVTLASKSHILNYDLLQAQLDISSIRELEDLLIDAFYAGVLQGKLDQRNKRVEIFYAIGRDVKSEEVDFMISTLLNWVKNTSETVKALEVNVNNAKSDTLMQAQHRAEFDKLVDMKKLELKSQLEQAELAQRMRADDTHRGVGHR